MTDEQPQPIVIRPDSIPSAARVGMPTILVEARVVAEALRDDGATLAELQQSIASLQRSVEELSDEVGTTREERRRDRLRADLAIALALMSLLRDVMTDGVLPKDEPPPSNVTIVVQLQQEEVPRPPLGNVDGQSEPDAPE